MEPLPPEVVEQIKEIVNSTVSDPLWNWGSILSTGFGVLAGGLLSVGVLFLGEYLSKSNERNRQENALSELRMSVIAGIVGEVSYNLGWLRHMKEALREASSDPAKIYAGASTSHWNGVQEQLTPAEVPVPLQNRLRTLYVSFERANYLFSGCVDLLVGPGSLQVGAGVQANLYLGMCQQIVERLEERAEELASQLMNLDARVQARLDEDILKELRVSTAGTATGGEPVSETSSSK